MRMQRKGEASQAEIISLALLLVILFILFLNFGEVRFVAENLAVGGTCGFSSSVASMRVEKACFLDVESPTALDCPRKNIEIRSDEKRIAFKGNTAEIELDDFSKEEIEKIFADELVDCWGKFGSGKVAVFPEVESSLIHGEEKISCHICAEIHFNQKELDANKLQILNQVDVFGYLGNNTYKDDKTYIDFLNNEKAHCQDVFRENEEGCWTNFEKGITRNMGDDEQLLKAFKTGGIVTSAINKEVSRISTIDPEKTYAVLMMRRGYEVCDGDEEEVGRELTTFAYIIPQDELEVCEMIIT